MTKEYLSITDVEKMTGLTKGKIYYRMRNGMFPRTYKCNQDNIRRGWRHSEIEKYLKRVTRPELTQSSYKNTKEEISNIRLELSHLKQSIRKDRLTFFIYGIIIYAAIVLTELFIINTI